MAEMASEKDVVYTPDGPLAREAAAVIPYYPFKGIERFYDIGGLLRHPALFDRVCEAMAARYRAKGVTAIGGVDARGFLFVPVALKAGIPFFMVRKAGKMPNTVTSASYETEYDTKDGLALQRDAVKKGDKVVLVDDLVATGGTLHEAVKLVQHLGGEVRASRRAGAARSPSASEPRALRARARAPSLAFSRAQVVECGCMVELKFLKARERLQAAGVGDVWALISEEVLTLKATLSDDYKDDGAPH